MAEIIADPAVKVVPIPQARPPSPASRIDTEMYRVLERAAQTMYPGAAVLPSMSTGASDQAQLRAKGIQSYGLGPASTESDAINYPAHGDVERLAESSLYPFVQYVWTVVNEVAARK
jgi:acetylornithine deacetylase/succinyl-diaminopimelate desuccinylase-like protein